jgi:cytochrome c oxidase cbb3-type subunit III
MWSRLFSKPSLLELSALSLRTVLALALGAGALGCGRGNGSQALPSAAPRPEAAKAAADPVLNRGAELWAKYCQLCHGKDATGYAADNAPSLVTKTFLESASDELIANGIRMGRPGTAMAAYGKERGGPLEERDIQALVRFVRSKGAASHSLPPAAGSGDPKNGAQVFEKNCQTCHGNLTLRGNALSLHNPELLAAASPAFLRFAIVNGRAPTPMPAFAGKLSDQEIDDVLAYIWGFRPSAPAAPVQALEVPQDLPIVINPKGRKPSFKLRAERFVAAEQVKKALDAKQRIVIIDARSPADWIQVHIPGALSVPYHDRDRLDKIPKDGTWVVAYCACPHHASGEVVDALRAKQYPNTAVLDEGILFWKDKGWPLTGEAVAKPAGSSALVAPVPSAKR